MRRALTCTTLLLTGLTLTGLTLACGRGGSKAKDAASSVALSSATPKPAKTPKPATVAFTAAGLRMELPASWTVLDSDDLNFGLAFGPSARTTQVMSCLIELRRQGAGPLSPAAKASARSQAKDLDYRQGLVRGRLRQFDGPTPDAVRLVHCRGPRDNDDWGPLDEALAKIAVEDDAALAPLHAERESSEAPTDLVELCTGTPARKTQVCVRRRDGAVYCGASERDHLDRVAGLPEAAAIACDGQFACARADSGALWCWESAAEPVELASLGAIRDLEGGCVATQTGALRCRTRDGDEGPSVDGFAELRPFGEAKHALREVEQVLPGTDAEHGCVIAEGALRCWDRDDTLALRLDAVEGRASQVVEAFDDPAAITDLVALGDRVCVDRSGELSCLADGRRYALDSCARRACGCSLIGLSQLSCEHEAHGRVDTRVFGHVGGIRAVDGACALREDNRVVCRGPITGEAQDRAEVSELLTGKLPGVLHVLSVADEG